MNWFLTTLLCVLLVEIAVRLPFAAVVAGLSRSGGKAVHVIRAKAISDHWKEKALAAYAQTTFVASLKLAGMLVVLFGSAAPVAVGLEQLSGSFLPFILGWRGIGFSIVVASLYLTVRNAIVHGRV